MANKRRQTLAAALKPPLTKPSDASTTSSSSTRAARVPKSRKSMIPRMAGQENEGNAGPPQRAPSPAKPRPSAGPRKSMGPLPTNASARPTSTPSKNRRVNLAPPDASGGGYAQADPRPKDKSYLLGAIKKMMAYLKKHGYDCSNFNAQKLVSHGVSGRDFNAIMTFLLRRLDPGFNAGSGGARSDDPPIKFEEEVSLAFRTLGYPLPISKTGIVAVGAPHTWPALIAAIDWLVDMLEIVELEASRDWEDEMENEEELFALESNAERATRQFDSFLRKSMVVWMNEDDDAQADLESDLLEVWERDNEITDGYLAGVDGECAAMKNEVERLERENECLLSEVHQRREAYATDIEKFLTLVSQLKEHQSELQTKVSSLTEEKSTMESSMEEITNNIRRLKDVIGSQELTVDEVRKMERQKVRLEEQCAQKRTVLEGHVNALKEANEKYDKCLELLKQTVQEYNSRGKDLELIPETAKNANGRKMEVRLNEADAESFEALLGVDVEGMVLPHVKKVTNDYLKETGDEKRRSKEFKERIVRFESECKDLDQENESIEDKITSLQEKSTTEQEKLKSEIQAKEHQLQLLQTKITTLNDPSGTESTIAKYNKRYKELQALQRKQDAENVARKKAVADEIRKAVEAAVEYEKIAQRTIEERNAYAQKKRDGLKLKLPTEGC